MSGENHSKRESTEIIRAVADKHDADIAIYAAPCELAAERQMEASVTKRHSKPNLFLMLATFGGSAESAYRMMRCIRHYYSGSVTLFLGSFCKSAGTLFALGADRLIMADLAELGPLDVQIRKPDELGEYTSGLTPVQALSTLRAETYATFEDFFLNLRIKSGLQITTKMAAEVSTQMTVGLFSPIFSQFDPMRLGELYRANLIAREYGTRIARKNIKEETLERLLADYPAHGFVIDRSEAKTLFRQVDTPDDAETKLWSMCASFINEGLNDEAGNVCFLWPREKDDDHQKAEHGRTEVSQAAGGVGQETPGAQDSENESGEADEGGGGEQAGD